MYLDRMVLGKNDSSPRIEGFTPIIPVEQVNVNICS